MAILRQEMKHLRSKLQEHRFKAVEGKSQPLDTNKKGWQNATRFCNYCHTNGLSPSWCRNIRDERLKQKENKTNAEKKVTFTQDYNSKWEPSHWSGQGAKNQDFQKKDQNYNISSPMRDIHGPIRFSFPGLTLHTRTTTRTTGRSFDQHPNQSFIGNNGNISRKGSFSNQRGSWLNTANFPRFPSTPRRHFPQSNS